MTYTGFGEGQRIGSGSTKYQYDGTGLSKQTDASGDTSYTSLPDGTMLSESPPGTGYCFLTDGSGSVVMTERQGTIANTYSYDPLGNVTSSTGSAPNAFTFEGMSFDSHTGFYYSGSGYYDPASGQSFGCKDKGRYDPGEDNCGEDRDTQCGGDCVAPALGGTFMPQEEPVDGIGGAPAGKGSGGRTTAPTTVDGTPYDNLIKNPNYAYQVLNEERGGLNRGRFGKAIHIIKAEARPPLGPKDSLLFGYGGEVYDERNGEYLDNVLDVYYRTK